MIQPCCDVSALERPEVLGRLFHPRKDPNPFPPEGALDLFITVDDGVQLGVRCHFGDPTEPHFLFFHGNGEIASDYDRIGPIYKEHGISFLVVDYRGYGQSGGQPTANSLLADAHIVFREIRHWRGEQNRTGVLAIMGRSLGSVPAIELASCYQDDIAGLVIDSGFARTVPLLNRLGVPTHELGISESDGFANFGKMKAVGVPTLIIHGQEDEIIPPEDADILMANSGSNRKALKIAAGCGHNDILLRCGDVYFRTISNFAAMLKRWARMKAMEGGFDRRYPRR
jgi:alpha-beta hydrolase superfamily lysophospholipase